MIMSRSLCACFVATVQHFGYRAEQILVSQPGLEYMNGKT